MTRRNLTLICGILTPAMLGVMWALSPHLPNGLLMTPLILTATAMGMLSGDKGSALVFALIGLGAATAGVLMIWLRPGQDIILWLFG